MVGHKMNAETLRTRHEELVASEKKGRTTLLLDGGYAAVMEKLKEIQSTLIEGVHSQNPQNVLMNVNRIVHETIETLNLHSQVM